MDEVNGLAVMTVEDVPYFIEMGEAIQLEDIQDKGTYFQVQNVAFPLHFFHMFNVCSAEDFKLFEALQK